MKNWFQIVMLVIQYAPQVIQWVATLVTAIRTKNPQAGKDVIQQSMDIAAKIVEQMNSRPDMTNEDKRERAWRQLVAAMAAVGVTLSETNARTLVQAAYQGFSGN